MPYVCPNCGSTKVYEQYAVWFDANTGDMTDDPITQDLKNYDCDSCSVYEDETGQRPLRFVPVFDGEPTPLKKVEES